MKTGQQITALINGTPTEVEILSIDSDPRCAIWVIETANRDRDHMITRQQIEG